MPLTNKLDSIRIKSAYVGIVISLFTMLRLTWADLSWLWPLR